MLPFSSRLRDAPPRNATAQDYAHIESFSTRVEVLNFLNVRPSEYPSLRKPPPDFRETIVGSITMPFLSAHGAIC